MIRFPFRAVEEVVGEDNVGYRYRKIGLEILWDETERNWSQNGAEVKARGSVVWCTKLGHLTLDDQRLRSLLPRHPRVHIDSREAPSVSPNLVPIEDETLLPRFNQGH